ncbi:Glutamate-gated chloride channel [Chionoecetes opilio]|uniref:Glutamate-gated chloride channel n=1 Tax=Chionoecetes opilio TaxID=41210 RepID=A0A8J4Y6N9_CHIOP|nr:Glutamate-gated chloride channel [Chionoecetes opilio]
MSLFAFSMMKEGAAMGVGAGVGAGVGRVFVLILAVLGALCGPVSANFREREKQIIDEIIGPGNYDKRIRPAGANDTGPAVVHINIMIRKRRIQYLTLTETDMVWMPDLFFKNEKEGHFHNIILPNLYIRIYPDGGMKEGCVDVGCDEEVCGGDDEAGDDVTPTAATQAGGPSAVPFPESHMQQLCPPVLTAHYCKLQYGGNGGLGVSVADVEGNRKPRTPPPRFPSRSSPDYCNQTNTGEYSCLLVALIFKREFSYYLIQYYIPCCMLVIVSWVSFWLDQNAVPARVALGVTTLLTMSTQTSSINQSLPPVSYTKREFSYYLIQYYIPCCMLVIVSWVSFWLDQNAVPARVSLGVTTLLTMSTQTSSINNTLPPVSYTKVNPRVYRCVLHPVGPARPRPRHAHAHTNAAACMSSRPAHTLLSPAHSSGMRAGPSRSCPRRGVVGLFPALTLLTFFSSSFSCGLGGRRHHLHRRRLGRRLICGGDDGDLRTDGRRRGRGRLGGRCRLGPVVLAMVVDVQAIDVWTGVCLTFVFGALLEFALVNYASRSDKHREKLKEKVKEQKKQWEMEHAAALEAAMQEAGEDGHTFGMPRRYRCSCPQAQVERQPHANPLRAIHLLIFKTSLPAAPSSSPQPTPA